MNWFLTIFLIILLIVLIVILKKFKSPRIDTINLVSGGVGSGKSSSAVCRIISLLRRFYFIFRNRNIKNDYIILSSIPMGKLSKKKDCRYIKIFGRKIKCYDLTIDILTMQKRLPQNEVILYIDEFSNIASQMDFNNPVVKYNIDEFFRNFRHNTLGKGYVFCIDQCSQNIFLQCRRRSNYCYSMVKGTKLWKFPIMIYQYRKILVSDEVENEIDIKEGTEEKELRKFIFFTNPFKWYDSFAYSERYKLITEIEKLTFNKVTLKRNDVLKLNVNGKLYYACLKADGITKEIFESKDYK